MQEQSRSFVGFKGETSFLLKLFGFPLWQLLLGDFSIFSYFWLGKFHPNSPNYSGTGSGSGEMKPWRFLSPGSLISTLSRAKIPQIPKQLFIQGMIAWDRISPLEEETGSSSLCCAKCSLHMLQPALWEERSNKI